MNDDLRQNSISGRKTKPSIKSGKSEGSGLNIFHIIHILYTQTDKKKNALSVRQIREKINASFDCEAISDETVSRLISNMMDHIFMDGFEGFEEKEKAEENKRTYGFTIRKVRKKINNGKTAMCYYCDHSLSTAEIKTLVDAVESYGYISTDDITPLVNKVMELRRASFTPSKYVDDSKDMRVLKEDDAQKRKGGKKESGSLLWRVQALHQAIQNGNAIIIDYAYYDEKKELVSRAGYPKKVHPIKLLWSNGYYYLQVYNEKYKDVSNLRIDRITSIEELEEKVNIPKEHYDVMESSVNYRSKHPVMYAGKPVKIHMLCRDDQSHYIVNSIIDSFGINCRIREATEEELSKYLGGCYTYSPIDGKKTDGKNSDVKWLYVIITATVRGTDLWATQYCRDCVIISPDGLRKKVQDNIMIATNYYNKRIN